jgi:hypothetical protein
MTIPIALLIVVAQAANGAQSKPAGTPILQVGVFSIGSDGKQQAAAYETSLATESVQYIAGCVIGGGNRPVPDRATDAWRLSGKVERMTGDEAVVRVDWQRIRSAGVATTAPGGSIQLTLHPGDRVPLDSATPDPTAGCGARTVSFEARFEPRPGWMVGPGGALSVSPEVTIMRNGSAGAGGARVGGGVGQGSGVSGTGRAVHVETSVASSNVADETVSQAGQASRPAALVGNQVRGDYDVDLFLVRSDKTHPEQPDFNLQGLILRKVGTADFAFSPFTIDTSAGPLNVQIRGSLRVTADEGSPQLVFTTMRTVRYSSNGPNRDASSSSSGSSTTRNPMPGPDDVLSFELPPIRIPNSPATVPEQYSVRVRIR